ncbi:hypothetical protein JYG51_21490, partial [Escherichia fergusonii]
PSTDREKIMVLGGGPNRIGQGIEFDYCCVHASLALREEQCPSGFMLNKEDPLASVIHLISLNEIDYKFCSAYLLNQSLMILIVGTVPECGISGRCCTLLHLPFLS